MSHAHREKVEKYVALAKEEGGEILIGGHRPTHLKPPFDKGAFYMPAVVAGLYYTSLRPPSFPLACAWKNVLVMCVQTKLMVFLFFSFQSA